MVKCASPWITKQYSVFPVQNLQISKQKKNERGKRGKFERRNLIGRNQNNNNQNTQFYVFQRSVGCCLARLMVSDKKLAKNIRRKDSCKFVYLLAKQHRTSFNLTRFFFLSKMRLYSDFESGFPWKTSEWKMGKKVKMQDPPRDREMMLTLSNSGLDGWWHHHYSCRARVEDYVLSLRRRRGRRRERWSSWHTKSVPESGQMETEEWGGL